MRLVVGDESVPIQVSKAAEGLEVRVGDDVFPLAVEEVSPGTYVLRQGDSLETFYCLRSQGTVHLSFRGVSYQLREEGEGEGSTGARPLSGSLEAPMPGKVIQVRVAPGQAVSKGQEILVVEAMKMENVVRAPKDGTVRAVRVKQGDMVVPGTVLVEIA